MTDHITNPKIIPISLGFVNAYLVKQDKVILIDTGTPGSEKKIMEVMKENTIQPGDLSLIILTHGHQDHAGSASILHEILSAPVATHVYNSDFLQKGRQDTLKPISIPGYLLQFFFSRQQNSSFPPCIPDILIHAPFDLNQYGIHGMIIPTPGHSKGSLSVVLDSGERFCGDLIFPQIPSGRPGKPFWADEPDKLVSSVRTITDEGSSIFYPGHGGPFGKDDILEMIQRMEMK